MPSASLRPLRARADPKILRQRTPIDSPFEIPARLLKGTLNKQKKDPKAEIRILDMNVAFAPDKLKPPTSLQITYIHQGSTRHIYVYHDDPEVIVEWVRGTFAQTDPERISFSFYVVDQYMAIRSAKLHLLQVAHPTLPEAELAQSLTQDFLKEGFLSKTGPRSSDGFKRRWFTLDGRKFMYHENKLDAYPKGEIFIGHSSDGYAVHQGPPPGWRGKDGGQTGVGFVFTLQTPSRNFILSSERSDERDEWLVVIQNVIQRPMTPQDAFCRSLLASPKAASSSPIKKRLSLF